MVDTLGPRPERERAHRFLRRPRVLLAEGSPELRPLLAARLEVDGFHVVAVRNGLEALDTLEASGAPGEPDYPDLLVVARRMSGLGGLEVLEALRFADSRTPVIVLAETPDSDSAARRRVLNVRGAVLLEGVIEPGVVSAWARRLLPGRLLTGSPRARGDPRPRE